MSLIDSINQPFISYVDRYSSIGTKISLQDVQELSSKYPYYGYVSIGIDDLSEFLMFSNNDCQVAKKYQWLGNDAYEKTSLIIWSKLAKKSASILDIGSYTGVYALAAAKSNPLAKVYAFEALDRIYFRLLLNKQVNQLGNLTAICSIVSDVNDSFKLNIYSGESILVTASSIIDENKNREAYEIKEARSTTIDSFTSLFKSKIGLVKIDVEGAEHLVLKGMQNVISQHKPDILLEILKGAQLHTIEDILGLVPYNFYQINDLTGEIKQLPRPQVSEGMSTLNTLISLKSLDEINTLSLSSGNNTKSFRVI